MHFSQVSCASIAVALLTPSIALGQTGDPQATSVPAEDPATPPPPNGAAGEGRSADGGLQDIVVTARRTSESLQTVPVAVTAISGDFLDKQNVVDVVSIPQFAPNLSLFQQSTSLTAVSLFIRGVGNQQPDAATDQAVGIYLDGVYIARAAGAIFDLVDLERLEVLRGPQGTLFGRNTIGGAIQLVTRKPSEDFHFEGKAGYGRFDDWYLRGRVDTGKIGNSPFSIAIGGMHRQRNGYVNNIYTPKRKDPGALRSNSITAAVAADLGDLQVNYNFDFNYRSGTAPYFQVLAVTPQVNSYFSQSPNFGGDPFLVSPNRIDPGRQDGFVDRDGKLRYGARSRISGHSLTAAWQASDGIQLKSITGYRRFWQDTILTLDGNGNLRGPVVDFNPASTTGVTTDTVGLYNGNNAPQKQWQFSQELQALGTIGDFSYVAGAYYFKEKASQNNRQALTLVVPTVALGFYGLPAATVAKIQANPQLTPGGLIGLNLTPVLGFDATSESEAVFGQVSWKPSALDGKLEATGGVRYTHDRKTLTRTDLPTFPGAAVKFNNVSWLGSLNYRFTPDVMGYARVSTGYRSGGIDPQNAAGILTGYKPEKVTAYEIGLKSELFDRKLRLNIAAYQTDYSNLQIQQFQSGAGGATSVVANAGSAQFRGFEAEVTALPAKGITVDGSVGYVHPNFKEYLYRDPVSNQLVNVGDEAHLPQSPKWNARIGGQYSAETGIGTFTLRSDLAYRSRVYFFALDRVNPFNRNVSSRPDYNLRARASLSEIAVGGGKLEIGIYADNLTNQKNLDFGIDFGGLGFGAGSYKRPRTYGADAKVNF